MVWATRYFREQLRGRRFILFTDHKPLATCAQAQSKCLTELQRLSLEFDFAIQHIKGINMHAYFLSRLVTFTSYVMHDLQFPNIMRT